MIGILLPSTILLEHMMYTTMTDSSAKYRLLLLYIIFAHVKRGARNTASKENWIDQRKSQRQIAMYWSVHHFLFDLRREQHDKNQKIIFQRRFIRNYTDTYVCCVRVSIVYTST